MNMVLSDNQLDYISVKLLYDFRDQLFQSVGYRAGKNPSTVLRTPDTVILKEVGRVRRCLRFVHTASIWDYSNYYKQIVWFSQLASGIPLPFESGSLLLRKMTGPGLRNGDLGLDPIEQFRCRRCPPGPAHTGSQLPKNHKFPILPAKLGQQIVQHRRKRREAGTDSRSNLPQCLRSR